MGEVAIHALHDASFTVERGELVVIVGPSGAGKTTLLSTIAGLIRAASGEIRFLGEDITRLPAAKIPARGCVMVPEGRQVFAPMTVADNLILGGHALPRERKKERQEQQKQAKQPEKVEKPAPAPVEEVKVAPAEDAPKSEE